MSQVTQGKKLLLTEKAADAKALSPKVVSADMPKEQPDQAVVEVKAAAVNPSDVKAALGLMRNAIWPRTPGRDTSFNERVGASIPLRRVGVADDVASAIVACATMLRYATGSIFVVDGGRHLG